MTSYSQTNTFPPTGFAGINTLSPESQLHIKDASSTVSTGLRIFSGLGSNNTNVHPSLIQGLKLPGSIGLMLGAAGNDGQRQAGIALRTGSATAGSRATVMAKTIDLRTGVPDNAFIENDNLGTSALFINASQQVIIGNTAATSIGATTKLAVEGLIASREVQVLAPGVSWPDYVFLKAYELRPLSEVERYIQTNGHLPEVPAAAEVEQNGHRLGEMDAILLKKIEELTLYLIEQNKRMEALEKENKELKNLLK